MTRIRLQINPKVVVAAVMMVALVLGLILLAQGLINTQQFQARVVATVKAQTGLELSIKGKASVSLLPQPTFYLPGVELGGGVDDTAPPNISADMMYINVSVLSLFSDTPRITSVTLDHPVLAIDRAHDNVIHWGWINSTLLDAFAAGHNHSDVAIVINDGKIIYHNSESEKGMAIQNIHAYAVSGTASKLDGTFSVYGHDLTLKTTLEQSADATKPMHLLLSADGKNKLQLDGTINLVGELPKINGNVSFEVEDLLTWLKPVYADNHTLLDRLSSKGTADQKEKIVLPVKFSSGWDQLGLQVTLPDSKLEGMDSAGEGKINLSWVDVPTIETDMAFTNVNYNQWKLLAMAAFQYKDDQPPSGGFQDTAQDNLLPKDVRVTLNFSANKLLIGSQRWDNALVRTHLDAGTITVNQLHVDFPGESGLSLFGIVSQGNGKGVRFEGSMETQGKSLRQFLTVFDDSASDLPDAVFGSFYAHSNIFISSEQLRLSEADVRINELRLNGGLVAYYDPAPRLEADVKLKNINFDYFRDVSRKQDEATGQKGFLFKFDKGTNFNWLKKLQTTVDLKVNVDHFTFFEQQGDTASFRLFAREGEFGVYDIRFYYPRDTMEASFKLALKDDQPFVNVLLNANQIDMNYFSDQPLDEQKPEAPADSSKKWSEDLIDMGWMDGINGTFDMSIGKFIYGTKTIDNLKVKATLLNDLLTFQSLSFLYWQGKCDIAGSMYGGKVPGISLGFTLYDAEIKDVLKAWANRDNIAGRISLSGSVVTSGVNPLSWVSQADAKVVLTARGVNVQGFNLQGVTDAVAVSRTASDVLNNVNLSLRDGSTEMSVDGNVNVKNGVVRTPGIALKVGAITGNLTGEVKLVPWTMDVTSLYQFPTMTSDTIPTMTVQLQGSADKPELQVDTSSLEAYVAKRITGR